MFEHCSEMDEATTWSEMLTLLANDSNESDPSSSDLNQELEISHQHQQLKTLKAKKDRRRKEGPVRYTTSLQRRKKAELKTLRKEAQQLNAQLEKLQLSRLSQAGVVPVLTRQDGNPSVWRSLAMIESEGRKGVERTNRELKSIMASHMKVCAAIRKTLGRSKLLEEMDLALKSCPTLDRPLHQFDFSDAILGELSNSLGSLRLQTDSVLSALEEDTPITCISQSRYHESVGKCVESTSTTPMTSSVQKAAGILWHHITNIIRKYEEANRVVLIGTTRWFLPTGGLQFEDHHWTTISPSPTNPLRASVVHSCYR